MMNSRQIAYNIIYNVLGNFKHSNIELNKWAKKEQLSPRGFAFITKIVYGVLERKIYFDFYLQELISEGTKLSVRIWIYIFLYETYNLNNKPALIANAIVEIAQSSNYTYAKFLNAIFHKISGLDIFAAEPPSIKIKYSISDNLYLLLRKNFSKEEIIKIAEDWSLTKKITFRVKHNDEQTIANLISQKEKYNICQNSKYKFCFEANRNIINSEFMLEGKIYIQDLQSMLTVEMLNLTKDAKVWDMCCAPGGKLLNICERVAKQGNVYATEINEKKLNVINENLYKWGYEKINLTIIDALEFKENNFDFILLDAPCSSTGTIAKNPEIKLKNFHQENFDKLLDLQFKLLEKAIASLKKQGSFVYSTCSILAEENHLQIQKILNEHKEIKLINEHKWVSGEDYNNGFYIAHLLKE